jgi:hypothetical protein
MGYVKGDGLASCRSILIAHCEDIPPLRFFRRRLIIHSLFILQHSGNNEYSLFLQSLAEKQSTHSPGKRIPLDGALDKRVTAGRALLRHPLSYADMLFHQRHSILPLMPITIVEIVIQ